MCKMLKSGRMALFATLAIVLSGCSSTPPEVELAESFAKQRAEMLSKIVPIELNGYNLLRAKAKGSEIELTLFFTGKGDISPIPLAKSIQNTYCRDKEIVSLLEQGLTYKLLFRDSRGKAVLARVIGIGDCLNAGIEPKEKVMPHNGV